MSEKNFALIGAAGYIAPRHMKAIRETGHRLVVALDRSDSVGVIDSYFPEAHFFVEFERFDRHVEKLRRLGEERRVHYVGIASPNYLHDAHIRFALRIGADAVCEKPLVLNPWNLDALVEMERESGRRVFTILQLRLHPALLALRDELKAEPARRRRVDLTYITARGRWYAISWKGDESKSGGITTNIGIHFFDLLLWLFGPLQRQVVHLRQAERAAGFLELAGADVRWFLSLRAEDLPPAVQAAGGRTHRNLAVDGREVEFSEGFTDLHTTSYREILAGRGCGLEAARPSLELVHRLRHDPPQPKAAEVHPLAVPHLGG